MNIWNVRETFNFNKETVQYYQPKLPLTDLNLMLILIQIYTEMAFKNRIRELRNLFIFVVFSGFKSIV